MAIPQERGRLLTIEELLSEQRASGPTRCPHCDRDASDREHAVLEEALRARIRSLEDRIARLEAWLCGLA